MLFILGARTLLHASTPFKRTIHNTAPTLQVLVACHANPLDLPPKVTKFACPYLFVLKRDLKCWSCKYVILVSNWHDIAMYQSMSHLNSICTCCKGLKIVSRWSKPTWEHVVMVDIPLLYMDWLCKDLGVGFTTIYLELFGNSH
jgi:hypothetical protein